MKFLKKPDVFHWTNHAKMKMRFYGLSEQRVKRVVHFPKRKEAGVAPNTIAMLQSAGSKKHPYEIWVMMQKTKRKSSDVSGITKIISAWKYPGITKKGESLPAEILEELNQITE